MDSDLESGILCLNYHVCVIFALKKCNAETPKETMHKTNPES